MLKAIKIRLYPDDNQIIYINRLFGSSRFVYNKCLDYKIKEYQINKKSISFGELGKKLVNLKSENDWIKDSHSKVLQQQLINIDNAYRKFFKNGSGFPKFKSKRDRQSCRFPTDAISGINGNRINIIKSLKNINFKCSINDERYLNKNKKMIKSGTLSKTKSGNYYFSILIDKPNKILKISDRIVGIDLGIKNFLVTSDEKVYENLKLIRNNKRKLSKLHKSISNKLKGSKNREKSIIKLAKFNEKIKNIKDYYLHSITNQLLSDNQTIVMEDLNVIGMMKNHNLSKSIQELSLYKFKTILMYKSIWYNKEVIIIDRFFPSSKLCSSCGYKKVDLTLDCRTWICSVCGVCNDRDLNASVNIKNEGIRIKIGLSSSELTLQESKSIDTH